MLSASIVALLLAGASFNAEAQLKHFGVTGGVSFSRINSENIENEKSRNGFKVGFYSEFSITKSFDLSTGLEYIAQGFNIETINRRNFINITEINLNYLSIPLSAVYYIKHFWAVEGGTYFSYLIAVKRSTEMEFGNTFATLNRDNFKNFDLGLAFGTSLNFYPITINFKYNWSFLNPARSMVAERLLGDSRNTTSQLTLGFNFMKPKKEKIK